MRSQWSTLNNNMPEPLLLEFLGMQDEMTFSLDFQGYEFGEMGLIQYLKLTVSAADRRRKGEKEIL